jgi:hypothetical protein
VGFFLKKKLNIHKVCIVWWRAELKQFKVGYLSVVVTAWGCQCPGFSHLCLPFPSRHKAASTDESLMNFLWSRGFRVDVSSYMLLFFFEGTSVAFSPPGSTWHIILQPLTEVPGSHAISRPVMQTNSTTNFTAEVFLKRQTIMYLCHSKRSSLDPFHANFCKHHRILSCPLTYSV